jgi:hypothetical protein
MKIKTILVLVELDNGAVHQALAPADQKREYLRFLRDREEDAVLLSTRVEPVTLTPIAPECKQPSPANPNDKGDLTPCRKQTNHHN